jgi:hypothetical protein
MVPEDALKYLVISCLKIVAGLSAQDLFGNTWEELIC